MADIRVELSNGDVLLFPEDTPPEVIRFHAGSAESAIKFGDRAPKAKELSSFLPPPIGTQLFSFAASGFGAPLKPEDRARLSQTPESFQKSVEKRFPGIDVETAQNLDRLKRRLVRFGTDDTARLASILEIFPNASIFKAPVGGDVFRDIPGTGTGIAAAQPLLAGAIGDFPEKERVPDERLFFTIPGIDEVFAFNRKGLSVADLGPTATELLTAVSLIIPQVRAGRIAGEIGAKAVGGFVGSQALRQSTFIPRIGEIIGVGAAGAETQALLDVQAGVEDIGERAFETGLAFATFEAIGTPILNLGIRQFAKLRALATSRKLIKNGELTEEARILFKENNLPIDISPEGIVIMNDFLKQGGTREQLIQVAKGAALPKPIQQTTGAVTGEPALLEAEAAARAGELGPDVSRIARSVEERQMAQAAENIPAIGERLNPRGTTPAEVQAAQVKRRQILKQNVDRRFDLAREKGEAVGVTNEGVVAVRDGLENSVRDFPIEDMPAVNKILGDLDDTIAAKGITDINKIFEIRVKINKNRTKIDSPQNKALDTMRAELDQFIDNSLREALIFGDEAALKLWERAIASRRKLGEVFQREDFLREFTDVTKDGTRRLKLTPDEMSNYLFGRSRLGLKRGLERDLRKLKAELPSEQFDAIREAAWNRFFRNTPEGEFPTSFGKDLNLALKDNSEIMNLLFTKEELSLFKQLDEVVAKIKNGEQPSPEFLAKAKGFEQRTARLFENIPILNFFIVRPLDISRGIRARGTARESLRGVKRTAAINAGRAEAGIAPILFGPGAEIPGRAFAAARDFLGFAEEER